MICASPTLAIRYLCDYVLSVSVSVNIDVFTLMFCILIHVHTMDLALYPLQFSKKQKNFLKLQNEEDFIRSVQKSPHFSTRRKNAHPNPESDISSLSHRDNNTQLIKFGLPPLIRNSETPPQTKRRHRRRRETFPEKRPNGKVYLRKRSSTCPGLVIGPSLGVP